VPQKREVSQDGVRAEVQISETDCNDWQEQEVEPEQWRVNPAEDRDCDQEEESEQ